MQGIPLGFSNKNKQANKDTAVLVKLPPFLNFNVLSLLSHPPPLYQTHLKILHILVPRGGSKTFILTVEYENNTARVFVSNTRQEEKTKQKF